jgi:hypothetical protein
MHNILVKLNSFSVLVGNFRIIVKQITYFNLLLKSKGGQLETRGEICKVLNFVLKFDLRDNINGGTYSLVQAAYLLKLRRVALTQDALLRDVSRGRFL